MPPLSERAHVHAVADKSHASSCKNRPSSLRSIWTPLDQQLQRGYSSAPFDGQVRINCELIFAHILRDVKCQNMRASVRKTNAGAPSHVTCLNSESLHPSVATSAPTLRAPEHQQEREQREKLCQRALHQEKKVTAWLCAKRSIEGASLVRGELGWRARIGWKKVDTAGYLM